MLFTGLLGLGLFSTFVSILSRVFLCLAVYKDAKEHDAMNTLLWTVLVALFGWLPVLIYAFLRYRKEKEWQVCQHCGQLVQGDYPVCKFCKQPTNNDNKPVISQEVKKFLILSAIFYLADALLAFKPLINFNVNVV